MIKWFIRILFLLTAHCSLLPAQVNLVPNPSFEDTVNCTLNFASPKAAKHWFSPTNCTPDYYSSFSNCGFSSLNNPSGYQLPRTGGAYMGSYFWNGGTREYIGVKLDSILESGKKYKVEFYISRADNFMDAIDRFGTLLSNDTIGFFGGICQQITLSPQIENLQGNIIADSLNWVLISGTFIANGGESFLTIGNFYNNVNTSTSIANSSGFNGAYYYIEDVSLKRCDSCTVSGNFSAVLDNSVIIYPNPFSTVAEISFSLKEQNIRSVTLFNLSGVKVDIDYEIENSYQRKKIVLHRNNLNEGIYILRINGSDTFLSKKVVIMK